MLRRLAVLLVAVACGAQAKDTWTPRPVPARFTSHQYTLTFPSLRGTTYCPLAKDWVGSDHGTVIFLQRPRVCGGMAYPSSTRGFLPGKTPRIEVFYAYWTDAEDAGPPPCKRGAGTIRLFGRDAPLCAEKAGAMIVRTVTIRYPTARGHELLLRLVTTPARLARDLTMLRTMAGSIRSCTSSITDDKGKRSYFGSGPRCNEDTGAY